MDTEQTVEAPAAAPAKKKVKAKVKAKKRQAAPAEILAPADGIYTGLTVADCCDACNADGCVISGKPYCAHPRKGGLHSAQISDPAALKRLNHSKRILGKQMLEARSE